MASSFWALIERVRFTAATLIAWMVRGGPIKLRAGGRELLVMPRVAGAEEEDDPDDKDDPADDPDDKDDDPADDKDKDDPAPGAPKKPAADASVEEWKAYARKWENAKKREPRAVGRRARAAEKQVRELEAKLEEREGADKSEQEKAIEKAKEEGRKEADSESQKERRADRLEAAVTRLAAKGIKVKDGDDEKVIKFADTEDALLHVERAIARGDVDEIFDSEGKVQTDALTTALEEVLESKPHLAAGNGGNERAGKPSGSADGGKGSGGGKDPEDLSVEDTLKSIQKTGK